MKGFQADDGHMVKNDAGDYVSSGWKNEEQSVEPWPSQWNEGK